jgi:hypothetical protein
MPSGQRTKFRDAQYALTLTGSAPVEYPTIALRPLEVDHRSLADFTEQFLPEGFSRRARSCIPRL